MCGITAIFRDLSADISNDVIEKMTASIYHRGPDDGGNVFFSYIEDNWQVCAGGETHWTAVLGSRRLSILDTSSAGHMPMVYREKLWIVYNGEVYNFIELRTELESLGHSFRSATDTEVILAAYSEWGTDCFTHLRGMWGMVILDCARSEAIICRDRLGMKPLYLWNGPGIIAVSSEIKQLLHLPGFKPRMDVTAVSEYLKTGYEHPERCFFQDIRVVPAGTWLKLPLHALIPFAPCSYWFPEKVQVMVTSVEEAARLFSNKVRESIRLHLRSDVPVGCALSGGLDSSTIMMIMNQLWQDQKHSLHTFTSTFPGDELDEQEYVDYVVSKVSAISHYITPDPMMFLEEMPQFLYMHDEPVGSLSVYASYCVARMMREEGIPVTLNGQGSDEILSGYWQSYFLYLRELGRNRDGLTLLNHFAGALMGDGNPALVTQIPFMLRRYQARSKSRGLIRLRRLQYEHTASVLTKMLTLDKQSRRIEEIRTMFLPRLLKWEDRNSMASSVEGRYPFLDHELIEVCLSFAPETLYHWGWTKWPLRVGLRDILPIRIQRRKTKFGFEVPQDKWLRGPLRPTLQQWLNQDRPLWEYVERTDVWSLADQVWQKSGKGDEPGQALFRLFMFDKWAEIFHVS